MAYAKICDRCLKIYPFDTSREDQYEITDTEKMERLSSARGVLDLCPECYEELLRFITNES